MKPYQVVFSPEAAEDLERLFDHILERELASATGDLSIATRALESIRHACSFLQHSPQQPLFARADHQLWRIGLCGAV